MSTETNPVWTVDQFITSVNEHLDAIAALVDGAVRQQRKPMLGHMAFRRAASIGLTFNVETEIEARARGRMAEQQMRQIANGSQTIRLSQEKGK